MKWLWKLRNLHKESPVSSTKILAKCEIMKYLQYGNAPGCLKSRSQTHSSYPKKLFLLLLCSRLEINTDINYITVTDHKKCFVIKFESLVHIKESKSTPSDDFLKYSEANWLKVSKLDVKDSAPLNVQSQSKDSRVVNSSMQNESSVEKHDDKNTNVENKSYFPNVIGFVKKLCTKLFVQPSIGNGQRVD